MPEFQEVYDAVVELNRQNVHPSGDRLRAMLGGSKRTILDLRDRVYIQLKAEGMDLDPLEELKTAALPMIRRLLEHADRRARAAYQARTDTLASQVETLNIDVSLMGQVEERAEAIEARLAALNVQHGELTVAYQRQAAALEAEIHRHTGAEERAAAAEQVQASLAKSYDDLQVRFDALLAILNNKVPVVPVASEIDLVLGILSGMHPMPTREEVATKMLKKNPGLNPQRAVELIDGVEAAGLIISSGIETTARGQTRLEAARD